jgi:NAD(P)-dependent dehydrogenase (short-subunit alcohol dehydrogenase family)
MSRRSPIEGKVIAITGAARGIGLATAQALDAAGAVVTVGDIDAHALASLEGSSGLSALALDVTDEVSFSSFIDEVERLHGPVDVLINNAGIMPVGPFLGYSEALTQRTIDIDLLGVIRGCRVMAERMVRRGGGHIINVASIAGRMPAPGLTIYNAAKFGIIGFSEALDAELAQQNVRVSTILPSFTSTQLISGLEDKLSRAPATPEDVAVAIVKAVGTQRLHTFVPRSGVLVSLFAILPGRLKRWTLTRPSYAAIFSTPDLKGRGAYDTQIGTHQP